jgi:hypothetical protein
VLELDDDAETVLRSGGRGHLAVVRRRSSPTPEDWTSCEKPFVSEMPRTRPGSGCSGHTLRPVRDPDQDDECLKRNLLWNSVACTCQMVSGELKSEWVAFPESVAACLSGPAATRVAHREAYRGSADRHRVLRRGANSDHSFVSGCRPGCDGRLRQAGTKPDNPSTRLDAAPRGYQAGEPGFATAVRSRDKWGCASVSLSVDDATT